MRSDDDVKRDRLLERVDVTLENLEKWCTSHDKKDDERYNEFKWVQKIIFMGLGVIALLGRFWK